MGTWILPAVAWFACVGLGAYVAQQKSRPIVEGLVIALFFRPLGVVVEALLPTMRAQPVIVIDPVGQPTTAAVNRVAREDPYIDEEDRNFAAGLDALQGSPPPKGKGKR